MSDIFSLSPDEFSLVAVTFAAALGQGLTADQKDALGNFLSLSGQYLMTTSSQESNLDNSEKK